MRISVFFFIGLLACPVAFSADSGLGKEVFKSINWSVRQTPDGMTGAKSCTGLYRDKYIVQLTDDALFISLAPSGGVKGYSVRFDDEPASADRLASQHELAIQSVALKNDDFLKLLTSRRVRLQILTAGGQKEDHDIDLSDIGPAHAVIQGKICH